MNTALRGTAVAGGLVRIPAHATQKETCAEHDRSDYE